MNLPNMKRYIYTIIVMIVSALSLTSMKPVPAPELNLTEPPVSQPWSLSNIPQLLDMPSDDQKDEDDTEASLREITENLKNLSGADMSGGARAPRLSTVQALQAIYSAMPE